MSNSEGPLGDLYLESKVAGFVRSYIRASHERDSSEKQGRCDGICTGLERMLGGLLQGRVDGVHPATDMLPEALKVISPLELAVRGGPLWRRVRKGLSGSSPSSLPCGYPMTPAMRHEG